MYQSTLIMPSLRAFLPRDWWTSEGPMEHLCDTMSGVFDLKPIETQQNLGMFHFRSWTIDGHLISQAWSDAAITNRTKAQAENCGDLVFVHRFLHGRSNGVAGEINLDKPTGEVFLTDQSLQIRCIQTRIFVQGVYLPKALLGYDPDVHAPSIRFASHPLMGDLLNREMDQLFITLLHAPEEASAALQNLIACIKFAIHSEHQDGDIRTRARAAMANMICAFIEQNLDSPDLTVSTLLHKFGVSRASLYRIFEEKGGVRQYISDRRLFRAVEQISETPAQRGAIAMAAEQWGFSSASNFNRAVKAKFGVSPGVLAEPLIRPPAPVETRCMVREFFG